MHITCTDESLLCGAHCNDTSSVKALRRILKGKHSKKQSANDCYPDIHNLSLVHITVLFTYHFPEIIALLNLLLRLWNATNSSHLFVATIERLSILFQCEYSGQPTAQSDVLEAENLKHSIFETDFPLTKKQENIFQQTDNHAEFASWCSYVRSRQDIYASELHAQLSCFAVACLTLLGVFYSKISSVSQALENVTKHFEANCVDITHSMRQALIPEWHLRAHKRIFEIFGMRFFTNIKTCTPIGFRNLLATCVHVLHLLRPTSVFTQPELSKITQVINQGGAAKCVNTRNMTFFTSSFMKHMPHIENEYSDVDDYAATDESFRYNQAFDPSILSRGFSALFIFARSDKNSEHEGPLSDPYYANPRITFLSYAVLNQSITQMLASAFAMVQVLYQIKASEVNEALRLLIEGHSSNFHCIKSEIHQARTLFVRVLQNIVSSH